MDFFYHVGPDMKLISLDLVASILINESACRPEKKLLVGSKFTVPQKITKVKLLRHGLPILFFKTET